MTHVSAKYMEAGGSESWSMNAAVTISSSVHTFVGIISVGVDWPQELVPNENSYIYGTIYNVLYMYIAHKKQKKALVGQNVGQTCACWLLSMYITEAVQL